jgi:hypothetical protein
VILPGDTTSITGPSRNAIYVRQEDVSLVCAAGDVVNVMVGNQVFSTAFKDSQEAIQAAKRFASACGFGKRMRLIDLNEECGESETFVFIGAEIECAWPSQR